MQTELPRTSYHLFMEITSKEWFFPFPDYLGEEMTITDACPTRSEVQVHQAIRTLLKRMNITLIAPERAGAKGTCCGDSSYGKIPTQKVKFQVRKKASEMPVEDTVVYCVSCSKPVHIGGKKPHYMIDLLFNEETIPKTNVPMSRSRAI